MKAVLLVAGLLHAGFVFAEMYPWSNPLLLSVVSRKRKLPQLPKDLAPGGGYFTDQQQLLLAGIVHNAGIYNAILAGGFLWATCPGVSTDVARVMLIGAVIAGIFGAVTLKTWVPGLQVVVGAIGLYFIKT